MEPPVPDSQIPAHKTDTPLLQLLDVTVDRRPVRIFDRISLTIPSQTHTAILGANGSGKTSLLKLLLKQFYPSIDGDHTGTVRIHGRSDWQVDELRKRMGIVSGELDYSFCSGRSGRMTGFQGVVSGFSGVRLARHMPPPDAAQRQAALEALEQMGATHLHNRTLESMSTGERRRTLIARALVHRPQTLVLDEPTTGLDLVARKHLLQQLQQLANAGTTIILVTHHIEEVLPAIEHIIFLHRGTIENSGTRQALLQSAPLSKLFGGDIRVRTRADGFIDAEVH